MMANFEVLNAEDQAVRAIRSYLGTLQRYRNTSMAVHNRHVEAVEQLGADLLFMVNEIADSHHGNSEVARWVAKFHEFVLQWDLIEGITRETINEYTNQNESEVFPDTGSNRPGQETGTQGNKLGEHSHGAAQWDNRSS